jgi:acetyltransferase-like isoleucine patch superfamily enzyme
MPENVAISDDVYVDSSYGFALFDSIRPLGFSVGRASGVYDRAAVIAGPHAVVRVGEYTVLNGTYVISDDRVDIGNNCLLAWGAVLADNWCETETSRNQRHQALIKAAEDPLRHPPAIGKPARIVIEDNVWVGFDAVILPGVTLGRGCIVGCRSIVRKDVPPYAIVGGDPGRLIGSVQPDDTEEARQQALASATRAVAL